MFMKLTLKFDAQSKNKIKSTTGSPISMRIYLLDTKLLKTPVRKFLEFRSS